MRRAVFALMFLAGILIATNAYPYFPLDKIEEQQGAMREMITEMRAVLETQRALIQALPPEKQDELARENARMIERNEQMRLRAESQDKKGFPPYAYSPQLGSYLRSTMQRGS